MAPATIQPKLHQEKEINAPHFNIVGDRLFPRLRALYGLVHKSYTMSTRNLALRVRSFAEKAVSSDPCASFDVILNI